MYKREIFKATPIYTLTTPIFDQRWPALAPLGLLLYLRAAIRLVFSQQELYGAHTPCTASQVHALLICFVYVYEHVCVPVYLHEQGIATQSMLHEDKGSAVVMIVQPW